jgi:Serine dehydrogenase proteinase
MGLFHEYVSNPMTPQQLEQERKRLLTEIGRLRNTEVIVYAVKMGMTPVPVENGIVYDDILPFSDLVEGMKGRRISVILETPGGVGEVGVALVDRLHERFDWVEFIVPGVAMSTGTIMCLGGHEILMGPNSALGPIDAQLVQDGKRFSADALIEGFNAIKSEVDNNGGRLNPAYIPILQRLSPGELQNAHNALEFARATVTDWLARYKFANWSRDGIAVGDEQRRIRAREIAEKLAKQSQWHTHGRPLRIPDLRGLGLKIVDFSETADLYDAIRRYFVLLRFVFDRAMYKIFESANATIARHYQIPLNPQQMAAAQQIQQATQQAPSARVDTTCSKCGLPMPFQVDFEPGQPLQSGVQRFPNTAAIACPRCGTQIDLRQLRALIEANVGKKALDPQPTT